jgi:hypothetical protein
MDRWKLAVNVMVKDVQKMTDGMRELTQGARKHVESELLHETGLPALPESVSLYDLTNALTDSARQAEPSRRLEIETSARAVGALEARAAGPVGEHAAVGCRDEAGERRGGPQPERADRMAAPRSRASPAVPAVAAPDAAFTEEGPLAASAPSARRDPPSEREGRDRSPCARATDSPTGRARPRRGCRIA